MKYLFSSKIILILIVVLLAIIILLYFANSKLSKFPEISFDDKTLFIEKLNKHTEDFIAKKNVLTTNYKCSSQIENYEFDETEAMKGLYKIFYFSSCFGYRVELDKIIEGSSFTNSLVYVEIEGTNSLSLPITKSFIFDFPKEAYNNEKSLKHIGVGVELLSKYDLSSNTELYDQAKNWVIGIK